MSIKSAKSLYEECSEIIERSYSVRSYSDEEYSCDDEDECLARELMSRLTPAALSKLRRCFRRGRDKRTGVDLDRKVQEVMRQAAAAEGIEFATNGGDDDNALWIDEKGFVTSLDDIFGHHKYTTHAHKLFQLLDPFSTGRVKWRALVDRLVAVGAKKTRTRADVWTPVKEPRMEKLDHCKRETIIKLVSIERKDSFCYVAVSKGGRVGVYSGLLQLMHSYEIFYHRSGIQRRVKNRWITDCIYLDDVQYILISASDRSLTFYDAATLTHTPIFCITGLPNIPTCMSYTRNPAGATGTCELALGSELGDVTRLRFLQPAVSLLYSKSDRTNYYFWMELTSPPHTSYLHISTWRKLHARSVRRISYLKGGEFIITCSHDSNVSVRLRHVTGKLDDYTFKVQRGVTCFHAIPSLHVVATGSPDGVVRLWEAGQGSPFATLTAPGMAAVLDVALVPSKEIVLGYCNNCWLHIWDLHEECLLQTIKIKFPFLGVLGKKVEFGAFCIHPGPARKQISEDDSTSDPLSPTEPLDTASRRSSVYQGSTGGLLLQPDHNGTSHNQQDDVEYKRFSSPELLFTCCDYVCTIELAPPDSEGIILPPPGDTLTARRPSFWDMPDEVFKAAPLSSPPSSPRPPAAALPTRAPDVSSTLLSPSTAEYPQDLDTLLENAGLQGILEKDFVLMQGLKHDLNKKLVDIKANSMKTMSAAVNMGAPHLGLKCFEPGQVLPGDEMMDEYRRVMRLFPETSFFGTPTSSNNSTPRKRHSSQANQNQNKASPSFGLLNE